MESDSENEFVDATEFVESDPALSGGNSGLVLNNAYHYFVSQLSMFTFNLALSTDIVYCSEVHGRIFSDSD